jgi:hypothetical protein
LISLVEIQVSSGTRPLRPIQANQPGTGSAANTVCDAEGLRDGGRVEEPESTGPGDHCRLSKILGITCKRRGFQPAQENVRRIDGVHSGTCRDDSVSNRPPCCMKSSKCQSVKNDSSPSSASNEMISGSARHMRSNGRAAQQCSPASAPRTRACSSVAANTYAIPVCPYSHKQTEISGGIKFASIDIGRFTDDHRDREFLVIEDVPVIDDQRVGQGRTKSAHTT